MSALRSVALALAASLVLVAMATVLWRLRVASPLVTLDDFAHDSWMLARNQHVPVPGFKIAYPQIVIIDIDDESMQTMGRWPWPRSVLARLVRKLHEAGARVVAFDVVLDQQTGDSKPLVDALAQMPAAVLATLYRVGRSDTVEVDQPLSEQLPRNVRLAAVGVDPDRGVLRRARLAVDVPGGALPSLSLAAWCAANDIDAITLERDEIRAGTQRIPAREGEVLIDWCVPDLKQYGMAQGYRELFPLCEVVPFSTALELEPAVAKELLKGRIVLVGTRAQAFQADMQATPLGDMPGIIVHANLLIDLIEGRFLTEWPHRVECAVLVFSAVLVGLAMGLRVNPILALLFGLALYAAWWWAARRLFTECGIVVGIAAPAPNALVFTLLLAWQNVLEAREKAHMRSVFGQYLSPIVVEGLVSARRAGRLGLEGKREKVTILFADIRGFTALSSSIAPEEVVRTLNEYFTAMAEIAVSHGGYIDKYGGDSIMVVYSAPFQRPDDALHAVRAAIDMQRRVAVLNQAWQADSRTVIEVGMGLDTGEVVLGNIGSPLKREYTVIGDHVNIAARLCGAAQRGQVLISANTWNEVHDEIEANPLPPLNVKGKTEPLAVYELKLKGDR